MPSDHTFKGNLEVETIHMLLVGLTTFFVFMGLAVDILTEKSMLLWLVFLATSFVLFLFGIMAKYFPKVVIFMVLALLSFISLYGIFFLFVDGNGVMLPQLFTLFIYVTVMGIINYSTLIKQVSGAVVDMDIKTRKTNMMTTYSKLRRRKSRRNSSRSHTSTNVKSGTYRG